MSPVHPPPFLDRSKSDACVHCGLCLQACPTFLETGNENDSPRGRIHLMRGLDEGKFPLTENIAGHIDRCLGCRACEAVCPSGVEYGLLLEETRQAISKHRTMQLPQKLLQKIVVERLLTSPKAMRLSVIPARMLQRAGLTKFLPTRLQNMVKLIPQKNGDSSDSHFIHKKNKHTTASAGMMSGCVASVLFSNTNKATIAATEACGYHVTLHSGGTCCGAIHAHAGNLIEARNRAKKMIAIFEDAGVDIIVVNAAGCGSTMKEYPQLLKNDTEWEERAIEFSRKVRDVTEILEELPDGIKSKEQQALTTYHDACHLCHAQHIAEQPRNILRKILGKNFTELPESDICCGSAGSYNITQPELAQRLGARKARNIISTGATVVVTSNIGCIMQIRAGLKNEGAHGVEVVHIADWVMAV